MKNLLLPLIACGLAAPLHATVLLNDTFSDASRTNANLPDSAAWIMAGTGTTGGSATSTVVSGALVSQSNSGFSLSAAFASHALAVGETIRLSFSVTTGFNGTASADSFRFGLFNSGGTQPTGDSNATNGSNAAYNAWTGYSFWSPYGSVDGTTSSIRERMSTDNILYAGMANTSRSTSAYTSGNLANGTAYQGSFSITNNGGTLTITAVLGDTFHSWTDSVPTATTFDSLAFFVGGTPIGNAGSFTLDNVLVEVVPEPSSLALAAIAPLFLLRRRRLS